MPMQVITIPYAHDKVFTRDSIYATARMLSPVRPSIRLSVRLSHGWIKEKRLKLGL